MQAPDQPNTTPTTTNAPLPQNEELLQFKPSSTVSDVRLNLPKKITAPPLVETGTQLSPTHTTLCRKLTEQVTILKDPLSIPEPIQTVPATAKTAPPSKPFRKDTPAQKTALSNYSANATKKKSRLPLVILKPKTEPTFTKPLANATIASLAQHRLPGISNSSHLADHFSVSILRNLYTSSGPTNTFKPFLSSYIIDAPEAVYEVALRFWVARLHTVLQMGGGEAWSVAANGHGMLSPDIGSWPAISSCQQVSGDVWKVITSDACVYLCIGPSGDVIHRDASVEGDLPIRPDWQAYLASPSPLSALVKTKEATDFPGGIFRGFRGRREERQIAERTILSSCVLQR